MAYQIDHTLAILQSVMNAHSATLSQASAGPPPLVIANAVEPRADLAMRLLTHVEERFGLDINKAIAEKLLRILEPNDLPDLRAHVALLEQAPSDHSEWISLIERLTVHETYVMRDPDQLNLFGDLLPALIGQASRSHASTLRFWSIGCSSGEEAFTIAALVLRALLATGNAVENGDGITPLAPWKVEILGSDISPRALALANNARYETGPLSSFRNELQELGRLFPAAPKHSGSNSPVVRTAHPCLRSTVRFAPFNLLSDPLPSAGFHAICCRNVLVYFSARARRIAYTRLADVIRPGGYLLLGPTDTLETNREFETLWAPGAVIHRRRSSDA
jgi:chemotaxis protein methyltransferase CheR